MSHLPNTVEYDPKASQASGKDVTCVHDEIYGKYQPDTSMKPKKAATPLPKPPSPFTLKG